MEINKIKQGKQNRQRGKRWEEKIRTDLTNKGYFVSKWTSNIDLETGNLVPAKPKYNPFLKRILFTGVGFPDFFAYKKVDSLFDVIGIECKIQGFLTQEEKAKCQKLLEKGVFNKIQIAKLGEKRGEIVYGEFNPFNKKINWEINNED
ncbi:MAG: hypothetical protein AABY22_14840 [Nanoarchaeota archaeon]